MTHFLWPLCKITLLSTFLWMILLSIVLTTNGQGARVFLPARNTCATYVRQCEQEHAIPTGLLHAMSKAESGLKDIKGRLVAWPWTINSQGQGYFYPSKQEAIAAVQALQAKGIKSIDVGCMQINLYYHPNAFKTLADAFDPHKNVAYGARFLIGLKKDHKSWHRAVAHYHSANPIYHIPYQKNVLRIWSRDSKAKGFSLAADIFSQHDALPRKSHIRRLHTGKTLKLTKGGVVPISHDTSVSRRVGRKSSHVRRLKLAK